MKRTAAATGSTGVPLEVLSALNKKTEPDHVEETLWSNLFPVTDIPDSIYSADTKYREALDIYGKIESELISKDQKIRVPPFFLEDGRLYSFSEFDEINPLSLCISSRPETIQTKQWLDDNTKHQKLVKLLNFNLKDLCRRRGFFHDQKRNRFYVRYTGGAIIPQMLIITHHPEIEDVADTIYTVRKEASYSIAERNEMVKVSEN